MLSVFLTEREGPAWDEPDAGPGVAGQLVEVAGVSGEGALYEDVGTKLGREPGTHLPLIVGGGKVKSSLVGDGVAATSGGVVVEKVIDGPKFLHLMVSTRVGSPLQRSYSDK